MIVMSDADWAMKLSNCNSTLSTSEFLSPPVVVPMVPFSDVRAGNGIASSMTQNEVLHSAELGGAFLRWKALTTMPPKDRCCDRQKTV